MIKIAICDDDENTLENACEIMNKALKKNSQEFSLDKFKDGASLLYQERYKSYDVIFLDIDIPVISGFKIANIIRENNCEVLIVFMTNHSELMRYSFDYRPFHFIEKMLHGTLGQKIVSTLEKITKLLMQNEQVILENDAHRKCPILIRDILYMEVEQHYVNYYIFNKTEVIKNRGIISALEKKYSPYGFARIHKKYLVNLKWIDNLNLKNDEIVLINAKKLPLSRNYKKEVDEKYTAYLRTKL